MAFILFFPEIMDKEGAASSVSSFMNFISYLDKTTYMVNMDIEIINADTELFNK